jgi:hypothetical protein
VAEFTSAIQGPFDWDQAFEESEPYPEEERLGCQHYSISVSDLSCRCSGLVGRTKSFITTGAALAVSQHVGQQSPTVVG